MLEVVVLDGELYLLDDQFFEVPPHFVNVIGRGHDVELEAVGHELVANLLDENGQADHWIISPARFLRMGSGCGRPCVRSLRPAVYATLGESLCQAQRGWLRTGRKTLHRAQMPHESSRETPAGVLDQAAAVIFDIDGTLIDTREAHLAAWHEASAQFGAPASRELLEPLFGKHSVHWAAAIIPDATEEQRRELIRLKDAAFIARLPALHPFPGAVELLRMLKQRGKRIALATGATKEELALHMQKLQAAGIVDVTVYDKEVTRGKPDPEVYVVALHRLGVPANKAVAVGDSVYDAQAAKAAGIPCIAVETGGFSPEALMQAGAQYVCPDVSHLTAVLKEA